MGTYSRQPFSKNLIEVVPLNEQKRQMACDRAELHLAVALTRACLNSFKADEAFISIWCAVGRVLDFPIPLPALALAQPSATFDIQGHRFLVVEALPNRGALPFVPD